MPRKVTFPFFIPLHVTDVVGVELSEDRKAGSNWERWRDREEDGRVRARDDAWTDAM